MSKGAEKISDAMEYVDDGIIRETDILRAEAARSVKAKNRGKVTKINNIVIGRVAAAAAILVIGAGAGAAINSGVNKSVHKESITMSDNGGSMNMMAPTGVAGNYLKGDANYLYNSEVGMDFSTGGESVTDGLFGAVGSPESTGAMSVDDAFGGVDTAFFLDSLACSTMCPVRIAIGETDNNSAEITFIVDVEEEGISYLASDYYIIQKNDNGTWIELKEGDIDTFTSSVQQVPVGLSIAHTEETAKVVYDWSAKYGSLEHGEYRLVVKLFRKDKDADPEPFTRKLHFIYE